MISEDITTCASNETQSTELPAHMIESSTTCSVIACIACPISVEPQTVAEYMKSINMSDVLRIIISNGTRCEYQYFFQKRRGREGRGRKNEKCRKPYLELQMAFQKVKKTCLGVVLVVKVVFVMV